MCSWADTSSIVFGRLYKHEWVKRVHDVAQTHYFSTHGCSAGSTVCFCVDLFEGALAAKKLEAMVRGEIERTVTNA